MRTIVTEALIIALETVMVLAIVAVLGVPAGKGPKADGERGSAGLPAGKGPKAWRARVLRQVIVL